MAHDVFISYSSKDKPVADAVCGTLERNGVRCWIAPRDITPGTDWGEAIIEAIGATQLMVLVFSTHANDSPQVKREVQRAFERGITVIPLRLQDVVPNKSLEFYIAPLHWLDAITAPMEQHLRKLTQTVQSLLARGRRPAGADSGPGERPAPPAPPQPAPAGPRPRPLPATPPVSSPPPPAAATFSAPHANRPSHAFPRPTPQPAVAPLGYAAPKPSASGRAVTALVLGLASCVLCFIPFIGVLGGGVAFVLGLVERGAINAGRAPREGATFALIGLVCGALGAALSAILFIGYIAQMSAGQY